MDETTARAARGAATAGANRGGTCVPARARRAGRRGSAAGAARGASPGAGAGLDARAGRRLDLAVAAAWGAAEATFAPVVPDVWLTWVALRHPARAFAATGASLLGALAGGLFTRAWGARVPAATSENTLVRLPALSRAMVREVEADLVRDGHRALLTGPTRGVPYKIYARTSGLQGRPVLGFVLWSVPARMMRFVAVTALAAAGAAALRRWAPRVDPRAVHLAAWAAFYAWFFRVVGREDA